MNKHSLFWDWYARCYDGLLRTRPYQQLLDQAMSRIPGTSRILLDAGCGTGNLLDRIRPRHPHLRLHGIDFSDAMLGRARIKVPDAELAQADLNAPLPYPDGSFDVVTCINVLYAVPLPERTVAELRRVLRPDGVLIASSPLPQPGLIPVLRAHAAEAGWWNTLPLLARMMVLALFNVIIVRRARSYHFMAPSVVEKLLGCDVISRTYANQNWFACAIKHRDNGWAVSSEG